LDEYEGILASGPISESQYQRWITLAGEGYKQADSHVSFEFVRKLPLFNGSSQTSFVYANCIEHDLGKIRTKIEAAERFSKSGKVEDKNKITTVLKKQIFIIHGHNDAVREAVARFVERLGLQPIVRFERPNGGKTIIEKFEKESDVGFAIALLTADDTAICKRDQMEEIRARQNVVFEMGFFVALLGRGCVALLKESGVAEPSDLHGIVYTELDSKGAWKVDLAKELRAAGFEINMNDAF
jgi:predicted nucleotide-binding protein